MAEREPLFRKEAVEYQKKKASAADLVRLSAGWAKAGFWLVLVAVAAIVTVASIARVDRVALALAMVEDDGAVTALLPAGQGAPPAKGSTATFLPADGSPESEVEVLSVDEEIPADEARDRFPELSLVVAGPVIVVRTSDLGGTSEFGRLRVRTGSESVILSLVPGLREIFGES